MSKANQAQAEDKKQIVNPGPSKELWDEVLTRHGIDPETIAEYNVPDEAEGANLEEIADKLGVTESKAARIAVNRLHRELFPERYAEASGYPTEEQLDCWEKAGLIKRCKPGEKSAQLEKFFKDVGV